MGQEPEPSVEIAGATPDTARYLARIGFEAALEGREAAGSEEYLDRFAVALHAVDPATPAEGKAGQFVSIFDRWGFVGRDDRNALLVTFAERIENVRRHAGAGAPAFAGGQLYPRRRKLNVVVVDAGIGVRESFLLGQNREAVERIERGESPLDLACAPLVTSKPVGSSDAPGHAGYGLYVVSELALRNGGTFRLTSGDRSLFRFRKGFRPRRVERPSAAWSGTTVSAIFDLDQLVPCAEVYRSLPPPAGYEVEDFFDG